MLALAACLYGASVYGLAALYWLAYNGLMGLWGVTADNLYRAPVAIRLWAAWARVLLACGQGACLCALSRLFARRARLQPDWGDEGGFLRGSACGGAWMTLLWGVFLLSRLVRVDGSLGSPNVSVNALALLHTSFWAAIGATALLLGVVEPLLRRYLPPAAALGGTLLLFALLQFPAGGLSGLCAANLLLLGGVLLIEAHRGGVARAAGWLFALRCAEQAIFGFPGASGALYETYPVRLYPLSGGNSGVWYGLATTILLGLTLWWEKKR